jgi:1-acyl-sn-glycerol-3-phosphate acyltransferase
VHRGTSDAAGSLTDAIEALQRGEAVIIYPEGTITAEPDYSPMQARTGVARIALACADIPVIPIGQWGAQHTLGRGGRFRPFPRKRHEASVGEPIDLRAYLNEPPDTQALRQLTDEVMAAITLEVDSLRSTARKRRESRTRASRTRRS